jgi:hypothetical protein
MKNRDHGILDALQH